MKYGRASSQAYQRLSSVWPEVIFGMIGLSAYGAAGCIAGVLLGWCIAAAMQILDRYGASELEWRDIETAVRNYARLYVPGVGRITFNIAGRRIYLSKQAVLRVTEGDQFVVWYKTDQWCDILDETDIRQLSSFCHHDPVQDPKWDRGKTFLIPRQDEDEMTMDVLALLRHFIAKASCFMSDVTAMDRFAHLSIWVESRYQEVSPVSIGRFNFKGKKDGRPVICLTDRKGYWILHLDGALQPFTDFDRWWNHAAETSERIRRP